MSGKSYRVKTFQVVAACALASSTGCQSITTNASSGEVQCSLENPGQCGELGVECTFGCQPDCQTNGGCSCPDVEGFYALTQADHECYYRPFVDEEGSPLDYGEEVPDFDEAACNEFSMQVESNPEGVRCAWKGGAQGCVCHRKALGYEREGLACEGPDDECDEWTECYRTGEGGSEWICGANGCEVTMAGTTGIMYALRDECRRQDFEYCGATAWRERDLARELRAAATAGDGGVIAGDVFLVPTGPLGAGDEWVAFLTPDARDLWGLPSWAHSFLVNWSGYTCELMFSQSHQDYLLPADEDENAIRVVYSLAGDDSGLVVYQLCAPEAEHDARNAAWTDLCIGENVECQADGVCRVPSSED